MSTTENISMSRVSNIITPNTESLAAMPNKWPAHQLKGPKLEFNHTQLSSNEDN